MNFEFFIAKRIHFSKCDGDNKRVTPPVVRIAMAGIAIGLAVMIVSVAIVIGFKKEVRNKVIGFDSHIQMTNFDNNISYESVPIAISDSLLNAIANTDGILRAEVFATKPGILKTETDFHGVVMKGMSYGYDTTFFKDHLVEGQILRIDSITMSNQALLSRTIANMLRLKCGDSFFAYFVDNNDNIRIRKLVINGVFDTGFYDYDKLFIICDIKQIRRINDWDEDMASGVGIFVDDYSRLDELTEELFFSFIETKDRLGNTFNIRSIKELNPMIFNWLEILDSNVIIILVLMIIVSGFTMISGLLIIILERTNMIGVLKALGENNYNIRKIFLYISFFLITKGMFWGNVIGLLLCFLQSHFRWLKLDQEIYYIDSVPIDINLLSIILINIGSIAVSMLMMIAPSFLISKIEPAKSIRFE